MKEFPIDDTTPIKEICDIFEENVKFISKQARDFIEIGALRHINHPKLRKKDLDGRVFLLGNFALLLESLMSFVDNLFD